MELDAAIHEARIEYSIACRGFLSYCPRTNAAYRYWSHRHMVANNWLAALIAEKEAKR